MVLHGTNLTLRRAFLKANSFEVVLVARLWILIYGATISLAADAELISCC